MPLLVVMALLGIVVFSRLGASEEGAGAQDPILTIDFPATSEVGSVETAELTIENPAASDIGALFVSFSALAVGGGEELPTPIVGGATGRSAVVDVEPEPSAVGEGVRFGFGPLESGQSRTIRFELRMPETSGPAANSIAVYDGEIPERATGGSLEVTVEP